MGREGFKLTLIRSLAFGIRPIFEWFLYRIVSISVIDANLSKKLSQIDMSPEISRVIFWHHMERAAHPISYVGNINPMSPPDP